MISRQELSCLKFIEKNMNILFFLCVSVFAFLIRYNGKDFISGDMEFFLIPWFGQIADNGGLHALKQQVGDYNLLYQTIIGIFTYIGNDCIVYYKSLSIFFDYTLALSSAFLVSELTDKKLFGKRFLMTYAVVLFVPTVVLNSAYWGQCDSIYVCFIIISLLCMFRENYIRSFVFLGIAFAFKLQTFFIIPFFIYVYMRKKKFSISMFGITIGTFWLSGLGGFLSGRSLLEPFKIYLSQTNTYENMNLDIYNIWTILGGQYSEYKMFAIILAISVCGMGLYYFLSTDQTYQGNQSYVCIAAWFTWTCIFFLPAMHERYTYLTDILLVILSAMDDRKIKYAVISVVLSCVTYSSYLNSQGEISQNLAVVGVLIYFGFTWECIKSTLQPVKQQEK